MEIKNYWIIVNCNGEIFPLSLNVTKRDCIANFPTHMLPGFKCKKVNVNFEFTK